MTTLAGTTLAPETGATERTRPVNQDGESLRADQNYPQLEFPARQGVHQLFEEQARRTPNATAVLFGDEHLAFGELDARANRLARTLRERGVGVDVPVGICAGRSFEMVIGVLGILKAGGAYVPLDPAYPKERLKVMVENSRIALLLTQSSLRDPLAFGIPHLEVFCLDEAESRAAKDGSRRALAVEASKRKTPGPSSLAYVIYTSGSTGSPKGVAMPHRPLLNLIDWQCQTSQLGPGARTLQFTSLSFDVSFQEMFSTWCAGGTLVLMDEPLRRDPVALLRFIREQRIERLFLPFIALQQLAEAFGNDLPAVSSLREIITAGEQLQITPKIVKFFESHPDCQLHNQYGPSESHVVTAFTLAGPPSLWPALPPIGRPIPGARIHLLDAQRQTVPPGEAGEICIGGSCLAQGYLHRPDLTAERFVPDPFSGDPNARLYQTGDLGRVEPDGNIQFLGRIDQQVKLRGFRIELGEIEATLRQHPHIRDAVVSAREDQPGHKRLVAYFILRPGQNTTTAELRRFLAERLPEYMVPSLFVPLEVLPLTPSGKVDREHLPVPTAARNGAEPLLTPRTPLEETLAGIWSEVLGVEPIGIEDNFFDLGGHSLLAVQVVSRIRRILQMEVPVAGLFVSPTIASLAESITAGKWKDEAALSPIEPAPREGRLPLSYSQQRLWFIHLLEPENFAYNVPAAIALEGELDAAVLEECLNDLVRRHEILRTTFVAHDGEPAQVILPELSLRLHLLDLGEYAYRDARAERLIAAEAERSFDLARGPLIRCTLLRLSPRNHILLVVMQHIISDGWSLEIFFAELARLYDAKMNPPAPALPALSIQYADYALWQRDPSQEELFARHAAHWQVTLAHAPSSLKLPVDHPPASGLRSRGARCSIHISSELAGAMQRLSRRDHCTPFMTLLTALLVLLNKWTRETDIVVGTVSAGRTRAELETLIGCFMNFLPIRLALGGEETGLHLLRQVKAAVLESQAHQNCPFEKIVEAVKAERRPAQNPVYNVGFLLQNIPRIAFAARQLTGKFIPVETDSALLDLRFIANETETGYSLACEYRSGLFERETIEQLLTSFCGILETLVRKPETRVFEFAVTPALVAQSQKQSPPLEAIVVAATFTAEPVAEALQFWLDELELPAEIQFAPYNQLFQQLLDPASLLSRNPRGLSVLFVRLEDWAATSDQVGEPLSDPTGNIERTLGDLISAVRSAAGRSTAAFLVCICPSSETSAHDPSQVDFYGRMHQRLANELASASNVQLILPEQLAALYPVREAFDLHGQELGHVPYTPAYFTALATMIARTFNSQKRPSPKVIVLDCDQTLWAGVCGEDGPDGIRVTAPHRELQTFMRAQMEAGCLLCLCSKNNPEDVRTVFERHPEMPLKLEHFAATRVNWSPKSENLKALAGELNLGIESLVLVDDNPVECAEVLANCPGAQALQLPETPELIPQFLKHCWIFDNRGVTAEDKARTNFYGQERQRVQARARSLSLPEFLAQLDLKISIAELSPNDLPRVAQLTLRTNQFNCTTRRRTEVELKALLSRLNVATVSVSDRFGDYGLVGCVIFGWEQDTLAVDTLLLSCRALGRGVEHRMLAYLGALAKAHGAAWVDVPFVASSKNQPALNFLESVGAPFRQSLNGGDVFRFPTKTAAEVAFNPQNVTADPAEKTSPDPLPAQNHAPAAFSRWAWVAQEANEVTKIQALIETKAGIRKHGHLEGAAPGTKTERELCLIWQELLRLDRVGIHDNFFELGGHSLLAVRLFAQIEKRLHIKLPIITMFQSPTVAQLAMAIDQQSTHASPSGLLPIQSNGARAPLFLVHGAGGDVLWGYASLAHYTHPEQPIYGIQASGPEEFSTLEAMAAHYVEKVRAFQPAGPYHLGGYCFGGNVAQEMARQLTAQGESVAVLALLDCAPSNCGYEKLNWWRPTFVFDFTRNVFHWLEDFFQLQARDRYSLILRKLRTFPRKLWVRLTGPRSRERFDLEEFIDVADVSEREIRLWNNHLRLLTRHVSKPYDGPITLFRTRSHPLVSSFEADFGWGKLADEVTVKPTPGSHEGIFMEPNVRCLARELEASLGLARQESRGEALALNFV